MPSTNHPIGLMMINEKLIKPWILIPAYQPTETLVDLVDALINEGFDHIVIVNDGSCPECDKIFEKTAKHSQVALLRHAVNLGKGAALKTGFNYFLLHAPKNISGIITADADGQHLPEDINKLAKQATKNPEFLLIGARKFDTNYPVPLRSRLGNIITRNIFGLLSGKKLSDTQTGLRYLPISFVAESITISSNGYEFELEMLIKAIAHKISVIEIPIKTIYFDNNERSHFNPLLDSFKIYFVFARFLATSMTTALVDYGIFIISYFMTGNILESLISSRIVAGTFNFLVAKNWVFHSHRNASLELPRYLLTVATITSISFLGINLLTHSLGWSVLASKLLTEGTMFSVSFLAMRLIVFESPNE